MAGSSRPGWLFVFQIFSSEMKLRNKSELPSPLSPLSCLVMGVECKAQSWNVKTFAEVSPAVVTW